MCLEYELSKEESEKIIKQARKRGYIRVWKQCGKGFVSGFPKMTGCMSMYATRYKKGIRKAENKEYDAGWYAYLSRSAAKRNLVKGFEQIKVCFAKPEWIKQLGGHKGYGRAGIFTKLAFPDWDKGTMTVREFKEMCKNVPDNL